MEFEIDFTATLLPALIMWNVYQTFGPETKNVTVQEEQQRQ